MKALKNIWRVILVFVIGVSCTPASKITASWINPDVRPHYSVMMVAAMTHNVEAKSIIEKDLSTSLAKKGVTVSKSIDVFPPNFSKDITKEDMIESLRKKGAGAILTVTLVDKQVQNSYVNGSPYPYAPMYGRFGGYYSYAYPMMYNPGYYRTDKVYYMETSVYDAKSEELVWSAQSETYNPNNLSGFSQELANLITTKLEKDGIVVKTMNTIQPDKKTLSRK